MSHYTPEQNQLLQLIIEQGILHNTPEHPIIARDGETQLRWVMNFLAISLQAENLHLAANELLILLARFKGRQLATIGTAAIPLMTACILASQGHYNGLMVRSKRKAYGTASLIDGRINPHEPVIVIDDSIGSGTNMLDCIQKLEQQGLYVEGCVCLVRFGYDSGYATLLEKGYRVEYLFDQLTDISPRLPHDPYPPLYPIKDSFKTITWAEITLPNYISPFQLVRDTIQHYWQTGTVLRPPEVLNQPFNAQGGIWLSLRALTEPYTSYGRVGFWHFPEESDTPTIQDLTHVAWLLATHLQSDPQHLEHLTEGALALSVCGALERCNNGYFDPQLHGLALRSQASPWKMGGALPNTPGIHHAAHLLHHARFHNTELRPYEPFALYRHTVTKLIEPAAEWPSGGASQFKPAWDEQAKIAQPITDAIFSYLTRLKSCTTLDVLPELFIPAACQWVFLAFYAQGQQLACVGMPIHNAVDLWNLTQTAWNDSRWRGMEADTPISLKLYWLSDATYLGQAPNLQSFGNWVLGRDAIAIQHQEQFALILGDVPVQQDWSALELSANLYQKSAIPVNQPAHWYRYRCKIWQASTVNPVCQLVNSEHLAPLNTDKVAVPLEHYLHFIERQQAITGAINTYYHPFLHKYYQPNPVLNTALILWLTANQPLDFKQLEASFTYLAKSMHQQTLNSAECSYSVLAFCSYPFWLEAFKAPVAELIQRITEAFNTHGQLPKPSENQRNEHYGIEILALIKAAQVGFVIDLVQLETATERLLEYVQHYALPYQYPVLLEVLNSLSRDTDIECAALLSDLQAKLLTWQQPNGAFLPDHPHTSPTLFTAQALAALKHSGCEQPSLTQALAYLYHYTFTLDTEVVTGNLDDMRGGISNGLLNAFLMPATSAYLIQALTHAPDTPL